ncbi:MAG: hypothetical protein D6718_01575 [Acidobacteria bacterium]|nr:MAG: hypothetical protein D6718_01575 [Acidobacteriota bacterium]
MPASCALALLGLAAAPPAGGVERALDERWRGSWVIVTTDLRSSCDGRYTANPVEEETAPAEGSYWFPPGELARVDDLSVAGGRVGVRLSLAEPVRIERRDGPFTLYEERSCRVELLIGVPRRALRARARARIESSIARVLERHDTPAEARRSWLYNERRAPRLPRDYEKTLAAYRAWKARRTDELLAARLRQARRRLERLTVTSDGELAYAAGLAAGIAHQRERRLSGCSRLVEAELTPARPAVPPEFAASAEDARAWLRGFADGRAFVFDLDLLTRLPACRRPPPSGAEGAAPGADGS